MKRLMIALYAVNMIGLLAFSAIVYNVGAQQSSMGGVYAVLPYLFIMAFMSASFFAMQEIGKRLFFGGLIVLALMLTLYFVAQLFA